MSVRLSYEPSVQALAAHLMPGARILGRDSATRNRVTWPVAVRATGLGRLEGGEIVIVPPGREEDIPGRLQELHAAGVAGVIVHPSSPLDTAALSDSEVAVVLSPLAGDARRLKDEIERYIVRRRRELFALDQRLHRLLVDAALGGAALQQLVDITHAECDEPVLLEAGLDVISAGVATDSRVVDLTRRSQLAARAGTIAAIPQADDLATLAAPILVAGRRRGTAFLLNVTAADIDDREVTVNSLAAAAAIVLAQSPESPIPSLEAVLAGPDLGRPSPYGWIAVAITAEDEDLQRLARAMRTEAGARGLQTVLGAGERTLFGFVSLQAASVDTWLVQVTRRAGVESVHAGISRPQEGPRGPEIAAREAEEALRLGAGGITRFEDVELHSLLARLREWKGFVGHTLGPLISRPELLRSLEGYLRSGRNVTQAAGDLGIHRNTLMYRLRRCRELLGTEIDEADNAFALQLALQLLSVHAPSEDESTD